MILILFLRSMLSLLYELLLFISSFSSWNYFILPYSYKKCWSSCVQSLTVWHAETCWRSIVFQYICPAVPFAKSISWIFYFLIYFRVPVYFCITTNFSLDSIYIICLSYCWPHLVNNLFHDCKFAGCILHGCLFYWGWIFKFFCKNLNWIY